MTRLIPRIARSGPDGTFVEGDDLARNVKVTLRSYLKSAVDDPDTGNRHAPDRQAIGQDTFAKHTSTTFFNRLPVDEYARVKDVIDANVRSDLDTAEILSSIVGHTGTDPVSDAEGQQTPAAATVIGAASQVMTQNRFSSTTTFGSTFDSAGIVASMPTTLGTYSQTGAPVRFDVLSDIGHKLMLRATGEFIDGDPNSPGVSLGTLIPGKAQLGLMVDSSDMYAGNTTGAPGRDPSAGPVRPDVLDIVRTSGTKSFGQMNSVNEPFSGFLPIGMTALAIAMVVSLRLTLTGLIRVIGLVAGKKFGPGAGKLSTDPLTLGQYGKQTSTQQLGLSLSDIGIVELDRDFSACVDEGLRVFFSFGRDDFGRIRRSPGFYANLVRSIVQGSASTITGIVGGIQSVDAGDIVGGANAVVGIIDMLKTSKLVSFLNVMAVLGDRSFAAQEGSASSGPLGTRVSAIDGLPDNAATRVMKGHIRGEDGRSTLAWRCSAPPSALVLPRAVKSASTTMGGGHIAYSAALRLLDRGLTDDGFNTRETSRLTSEQLEVVERQLDAEYVPFYFHDLRTNELISFNAFISSVSENFSPQWTDTNAYGRVDPVMTYGGTRREFSLSFHVVATSPEDLDMMYVKLNKLTTLLYPQYTRGRQVVDGQGRRFTQPFSQLPGASPVVRIRLGNLMRTNFSNLALARLFGMGSQEFIDGSPAPVHTESAFDSALNVLRQQVTSTGYVPGQRAVLMPYTFKQLNSTGQLPGFTSKTVAQNFDRLTTKQSRVVVRSQALFTSKHRGVEVRTYVVEFDERGLEGVTVTVPETALSLSLDEVQRMLTLTSVPDVADLLPDQKRAFVEPSNNAVVRSFRNVQGKGLPGVIMSMAFNWDEAAGNWDVDRFFARVPMLVKVDMSFTVIHDIPPGLDADGFNRAPIMPAGDAMGRLVGDAYDSTGFSEQNFDDIYAEVRGTRGGRF
jgi:hypothetical protein